MRVYCAAGVTVALAATLSGGVGATWATAQVPRTQTEFGGPVYPAYEGWYPNPDGFDPEMTSPPCARRRHTL